MKVIPITFASLFSRDRKGQRGLRGEDLELFSDPRCMNIYRIDVPLFQRKYCWPRSHWRAFFQDSRVPKGLEHHLGRLTFIDYGLYKHQKSSIRGRETKKLETTNGSHLLCVDGQQRITTAALLLASIRDLLFLVAFSLEQASFNSASASSSLEKRRAKLLIAADKISNLLFSSSSAASSYKKNFSSLLSHQVFNPSSLIRGKVLEGALFVPSHADRASFFDVLLGNVPAHFTEHNTPLEQVASCITRGKLFFNTTLLDPSSNIISSELAQWLNSQAKKPTSLPSNIEELLIVFCSRIQGLLSNVLTRLKLVYIELDESGDAQGSFQSMYAVGKVNQIRFQIKRPGMDLTESDLVRNYLLGFFLSEEDDEGREEEEGEIKTQGTGREHIPKIPLQSTVYYDLWLPIEDSFSSTEELDAFFDWYLEELELTEEAKRARRHRLEQNKTKFESLSLGMKMGAFVFQTNPSIFYEYADHIKLKVLGWSKQQLEQSKGPVISEKFKPTLNPLQEEEHVKKSMIEMAEQEAELIQGELKRLLESVKRNKQSFSPISVSEAMQMEAVGY